MSYNRSHPTFIQQKNARKGSEPLAYVMSKGKLIRLKKATKKGKCFFCSRSIRVKNRSAQNFCRACLDLAEII